VAVGLSETAPVAGVEARSRTAQRNRALTMNARSLQALRLLRRPACSSSSRTGWAVLARSSSLSLAPWCSSC
jgi:hypothetical protein